MEGLRDLALIVLVVLALWWLFLRRRPAPVCAPPGPPAGARVNVSSAPDKQPGRCGCGCR